MFRWVTNFGINGLFRIWLAWRKESRPNSDPSVDAERLEEVAGRSEVQPYLPSRLNTLSLVYAPGLVSCFTHHQSLLNTVHSDNLPIRVLTLKHKLPLRKVLCLLVLIRPFPLAFHLSVNQSLALVRYTSRDSAAKNRVRCSVLDRCFNTCCERDFTLF
jgi:hypothetical protein